MKDWFALINTSKRVWHIENIVFLIIAIISEIISKDSEFISYIIGGGIFIALFVSEIQFMFWKFLNLKPFHSYMEKGI
ncbi:MAG: hypothetical protein LBM93_11255 [Oscillospiraceae bacterium]|jgi:hypothetical protein|nr:hypothetical protein [Oscillospiraceae bacterium]